MQHGCNAVIGRGGCYFWERCVIFAWTSPIEMASHRNVRPISRERYAPQNTTSPKYRPDLSQSLTHSLPMPLWLWRWLWRNAKTGQNVKRDVPRGFDGEGRGVRRRDSAALRLRCPGSKLPSSAHKNSQLLVQPAEISLCGEDEIRTRGTE